MASSNIVGTNGSLKSLLSRRGLLGRATALGSAVALGSGLVGGASKANAAETTKFGKTTVTDTDILNFALNLEYLEAEFYLHAAYGISLTDAETSAGSKGLGTLGAVSGGRAASLSDPIVIGLAQQLAKQEETHVNFLRAALGKNAVPRPAIDIGTAFTTAAVAAGIITSGQTFDPYANDDNFLLGAFVFEDVGVTAYHGAAPFIRNSEYLSAAAGILAVEAYHAGAIRALLLDRNQDTPSLAGIAQKISDLRDAADGTGDNDQGITGDTDNMALLDGTNVNIAPTDGSGIAFSRTFSQILNIVYLGGSAAGFGFFPSLLNGRIK